MKLMLLLLVCISCAGCSSNLPVKQITPMAGYNKLLVRNINWNETALSEISAKDQQTFMNSRDRLAGLFRAEFAKYIQGINFFDSVTYGDAQPETDTLILEPKIYTIKAGNYMPGGSYTGLLFTSTGKLVGKYTSERRLSSGSNPMDVIEKLVVELAEDAASRLPYAQ